MKKYTKKELAAYVRLRKKVLLKQHMVAEAPENEQVISEEDVYVDILQGLDALGAQIVHLSWRDDVPSNAVGVPTPESYRAALGQTYALVEDEQ